MNLSGHRFACLSRNHRSSNFVTGGLAVARHVLAIASLVAAKPAYATHPEDVAALLKTATALQQHGDYAHCIPILKRILEISPRNYTAKGALHAMLASTLRKVGRNVEAKKVATEAPDWLAIA